jgi:hypothetical protein
VSFGLDVQDSKLISTREDIDVDVSVAFWTWAVPGAAPGLALALAGGKDTARQSMRNAIAGLIELLNFLSAPAAGFRRVGVDIAKSADGTTSILIRQCP